MNTLFNIIFLPTAKNERRSFVIKEISHIEREGRTPIVVLTNGSTISLTQNTTFDALEKLFQPYPFVRVQGTCLVNVEQINKGFIRTKKEVEMRDGSLIGVEKKFEEKMKKILNNENVVSDNLE